MKEFEDIVDRATKKMGDYSLMYFYFKIYWDELLEKNGNVRLSDIIELKDMFDANRKNMMRTRFTHGGGKKATKKKRK